jgi:predicted lysophospholipase L1 biosynthesis ABC-type transport system permease subunit
MNTPKEQLDAIKDMRNLMERSSRFLSLSGLSGVAIGIIALLGATVLYLQFDLSPLNSGFENKLASIQATLDDKNFLFLIADALIVLLVAVIAGILMSINQSKKLQLPSWDLTAKRLLINLFIPLAVGGVLCLIMMTKDELGYLIPVTLIFYGLSLVNASKYSFDEIRTLGVLQTVLGLIAAWLPDYALLLWATGFGILHIGYGLLIHTKHQNGNK